MYRVLYLVLRHVLCLSSARKVKTVCQEPDLGGVVARNDSCWSCSILHRLGWPGTDRIVICTAVFVLQNVVQEGKNLKDHPAPIHGH